MAVIGASAWVLLSGGVAGNRAASQSAAGQGVYEPVIVSPAPSETQLPRETQTPEEETYAETQPAAEETSEDEEPEAYEAAVYDTDEDGRTMEDLVFVWPVSGETELPYSVDELIYDKTMADWRTHDGVDIACAMGTRVLAAASGVVSDVYEDDLLGTTVVIDHGAGLQSVYANLAAAPTVDPGDSVAMSQVIGSVGDTAIGEAVEQSHLHFALKKDGVPADPADYLPGR